MKKPRLTPKPPTLTYLKKGFKAHGPPKSCVVVIGGVTMTSYSSDHYDTPDLMKELITSIYCEIETSSDEVRQVVLERGFCIKFE